MLFNNLKIKKKKWIYSKVKIKGKVTSLCFDNKKRILAGTSTSSLYMIDLKTFEATLKNTCHYSEVNDVCFPEYVFLYTHLHHKIHLRIINN